MYMELPGGFKIPAIGLGTGAVTDEDALVKALNAALEAGYRHIDTAYSYENEAIIGRVLNEWFSAGKLKREDVFVTSKLPTQGMHPDRVEMFIKKSLERLQLDYVNLYLIHWAVGTKYVEGEDKLSIDKTESAPVDHVAIWKKMEEQVHEGRTKSIGLSNFNVRQIDRIIRSARIKPACLQVELHVRLQQRELVSFCQKNGMVVVAYAPLGSPGFIRMMSEKGWQSKEIPDIMTNETVKTIAGKHKKTNAQVLLRYLLQRNIVAIPKSTTPSRVKENIDVFDFVLDEADMRALNDLEIGEKARIFSADFPVFRDHPEYPFPR